MTRQYFYSHDLDECASCGEHLTLVQGVGAVIIDAPGQPQMYYTVCNTCAPQLNSRQHDFVKRLEQRLIAQARELGAYDLDSRAAWARARSVK